MSTTIPIQDLDPSTSPPGDRSIRAVVTLSWPYSSSTQQCALLLSERDFRLRARGGQIRVKFSGPAARAVAQGRLGIGDEVVLELGTAEWATGAAVHVPGKSVGELHFGQGVRLRLQKEGVDDVEISVADNAVNSVEQEQPAVETTPSKRALPATSFRSSIGAPGSPTIYSSPAYMRKAAKFSYLEGISRLFEDEWNNQDLPRKRARTSIGDVKSWKVVDRTPSPEPPSPAVAAEVEEEMADTTLTENVTGETTVAVISSTVVSPGIIHEMTAGTLPDRPSPAPMTVQESSQQASPVGVADPVSSPPALLECANFETDQTFGATTPIADSALLRLDYSPAPPVPHPGSSGDQTEQETNPVTPRLVPMSSAVLPSTTPQISPLATKNSSAAALSEHNSDEAESLPHEKSSSNERVEEDLIVMTSPTKATERLLDQLRSTAGESEPATDPVVPEQGESVNAPEQWETDALKEEDAFSDAEADETLSAHENDDELMPEDDAEDIFSADELDGEVPSDDDTNEDHDMQIEPAQQWLEESTTEKDSDLEEQILKENTQNNGRTQVGHSEDRPSSSYQPGFAPASTLLSAAETPAKALQSPVAMEKSTIATPPKKLLFGSDSAVPSTEAADVSTPVGKRSDTSKKSPSFGMGGAVPSARAPEVVTPATKPTGTAKSTPKSARDKVMKRTFHSLFGLKATPSPEKQDPTVDDHVTDAEQVDSRKNDQRDPELSAPDIEHDLSRSAEESHSVTDVDMEGQNSVIVESIAIEETSVQPEVQRQTYAGSVEVQPMVLSEDESLDQVVQEGSTDDMRTAPTPAVHTQPHGLTGIDPGPGEQEEHCEAEYGADQTAIDASIIAPTPQKRLATQDSEILPPAVVDSGSAGNATVPALDGTVEAEVFETRLPDAVRRIEEFDDSEIEQVLPDNDHQVLDMEVSEVSRLALDNASAVAHTLPHSDQFVSGSQKRTSAVSQTLESPTVELREISPVDDDPQDHGEPKKLQRPAIEGTFTHGSDALMEGDEISHRPDPFEESMIQSPSATSRQLLSAQEVAEVAEPAQGDDVEILDPQQREPVSSQASFQSQMTGYSDGAEEPGLDEHSSRSILRGTAEDFSPMGWGSMPQRITDIVSDESALVRLRELESQDDERDDLVEREVLVEPSMAQFTVGDSVEQSPTGRRKVQAVEVEFQPFEQQNSNHGEPTNGVQPQEPTPQASINNVIQSLDPVDEGTAALQTHRFPESPGDLTSADEQVLESQLQIMDEVKEQILETATTPSLGHVEQKDSPDTAIEDNEQEHVVTPISPSATQPIRSQPQLSHAKTHETVMQPTPATSQARSQFQNGLETANSLKDLTNMAQTVSHEHEPVNMPTPGQMLPPQTPAKKSLRSRLSNVPDVISAWFSPKRSSIVAQDSEPKSDVGEPAATSVDVVDKSFTKTSRASGISTSHAYFSSLASLDRYVNSSSQQAGTMDILAVVTNSTKDPTRAKGGPRDYYTIFRVTDASMPSSTDARVEVFRPWKAVLPAADVGDVVLLRAFAVKSKKRKPYLLSTDTSGWCVWRFAEHEKAAARSGNQAGEGEKPVWARRMSHSEVREEVKGPPVEYGTAEKEQARKLRGWFVETRGDVHGGAAGEPAERGHEEAEVVGL